MSDDPSINISVQNPFPGLRAFNDDESHLFFGRESHVKDVRDKLEAHHFVAVVGTSGTGKSSLIRAGVLPSLLKEKNAEGDDLWQLVTLKPGNAPLENLAKVIAELVPNTAYQSRYNEVLELIKESSLGLVQTMRGKIQEGQRLLILVDQFEEVFRFADDDATVSKEVYNQFVRILIDTMRQRDVAIYTILTLRSDFLGDCVRFEGLPESINDGHYLVPRMRMSEVNRVITGPVEYANGKISPRLVQEIVQNLGDDSDQLPILQHALMRTYDTWKKANVSGEPMDVKHLEAVGGLKNALSKHADEAFAELNDDQQRLVKKIFQCLTVKTGDNRGVRRPMSMRALMDICQCSEEALLSALNPFRAAGRSFVLPNVSHEVNASTIFDISHESLMRGWNRLRNWADEEMESADIYKRIADAAALHQKGAAALWRNPELQLALDWKEKQSPTAAWAELYHDNYDLAMRFLQESKEQDENEKRAVKKRRVLVRAAVATFLVVVSGLSGWALFQTNIAQEKSAEAIAKTEEAVREKNRAESEKERAETEKSNAIKASQEADEARNQAEEQTRLAEAETRRADNEKDNAEAAAQRAIAEQERAVEQENLANQRSAEVLIEKQKADSARDESTRLRLISLSQNLAYESAQIQNDPELAALLAIESYKLADENGGNTNSQSIYVAATKALEQIDENYSPVVITTKEKVVAMASVRDKLGMVNVNGDFRTFSTSNHELSDETQTDLTLEKVNSAYISPGVDRFVIGLNTNEVLSYDGSNSKPNSAYEGHGGLLRGVVFRDASNRLITGGRDGNLIVWEGDKILHQMNFGARINTLSGLPGASDILVGCADGHSYRYNVSANEKATFQHRRAVRVEIIEQSTDGKWVAIGYSDGFTYVHTGHGLLVKTLPGVGAVNFIAIDTQRDMLAVTTTNKRLSLYQLSNLTQLPVEVKVDRPITAVAYNPGKAEVYIACSDRKCHKYATRASEYISQLESRVNRKLTEEEWRTFMGEDLPYEANAK